MLSFLQSNVLWGLFLGSFLAATILPFSSDALFAATLVVTQQPIACLIVGTMGNWLGGLLSFGIGWLGKWEWIEKWFHVSRVKIERHRLRVVRFGYWLALLTWLPIVGDVFAIALGFYRVKPIPCAIFMFIGKAARFAVWIFLLG